MPGWKLLRDSKNSHILRIINESKSGTPHVSSFELDSSRKTLSIYSPVRNIYLTWLKQFKLSYNERRNYPDLNDPINARLFSNGVMYPFEISVDRERFYISYGDNQSSLDECLYFINELEQENPLSPELEDSISVNSGLKQLQIIPDLKNQQALSLEMGTGEVKGFDIAYYLTDSDNLINYILYDPKKYMDPRFELLTDSREKRQRLIEVLRNFKPKIRRWSTNVSHRYGVIIKFSPIYKTSEFEAALKFIESFKILPRSTKEDMRKRAGFKRIVGPEDMLQDIINLAKQNDNSNEALLAAHHASNLGYKDILWGVSEYYRQNNQLSKAIEVYSLIPVANPHCEQALEHLAALLDSFLKGTTKGDLVLTDKEVKEYQEVLFKNALKLDMPQLRDKAFNALCGLSDDGELAIKNIGTNEDTLLDVAGFIKRQHQTLLDLQGKVKELESQLAAKSSYTLPSPR